MSINHFQHVLFAEENHYNPLGVVRSLGEEGIKPDIIAYGGGERVVTSSKYAGKVYHVSTVEDGYGILLDKYKNENQKVFVYTCDDKVTSFLDEKYNEIKDYFYFNNAGTPGRVTHFMDKNNINVLAEKHGLKIPKTFVVSRGEILDEFEYPIITKAISSNSGGWKEDVFICHNNDELKDAYSKITSEILLIQRYIEKKNELCLDGCVVNQGNDLLISIASKYNYILPGKYTCDYTSTNFHNDGLQKSLAGMFKEIGFEGIFSIEFLIDKNDELYFLEINFRNSTWSYTSTCVGMNLPILWAKGMMDKRLPVNSYKKIETDYRTIYELYDFSMRTKSKMITPMGWIKDLKNVDCFLLYNKRDPKPFWVLIGDRVLKKIHLRNK